MGWLVFISLHFWNCQITKFHRVWFHTTLRPSIWTIHLNKSFHRRIAGTTGIEPRPPAQRARAFFISPLPLGQARLDKSLIGTKNLTCFKLSTKVCVCGKNNIFHFTPNLGVLRSQLSTYTASSKKPKRGCGFDSRWLFDFCQLQHLTGFKPQLGSGERHEFSTG